MPILARPQSKALLTAGIVIGMGLVLSACAQHPKPIPAWGGNLPASTANPNAPYSPPAPRVETAHVSTAPIDYGRRTFTQGCTGRYSVRDTRTNRHISSGRAYNSGNGLIELDARGRQTRAISSNASLSVLFLPDCSCRIGGHQSGSVSTTHQFAAASCSAN